MIGWWRAADRTDRRRLVWAAGCAAAAFFVAGAATGWWAADRFSPRTQPPVVVVAPTPGGVDAAPRVGTMPDLRGLTEAQARQVLHDLGLGGVTVLVEARPAVAVPGTVIAQDPVGSAPVAGTVVLTLAAPAVVPDVVGDSVAEAVRELEELGARVELVRVYAPDTPVDRVMAVEPGAGEPVPETVVLTVSSPPAIAPLTALRPIEGGCRQVSDVQVDGRRYADALRCEPFLLGGIDAVYLLNREITEFTAVVGQPDDAEPGVRMRVQVLVDGAVAATETLSWGTSRTLTVDTSGALRLELRVVPVDREEGRRPVVFADPVLRGTPDAIQSLLAGS